MELLGLSLSRASPFACSDREVMMLLQLWRCWACLLAIGMYISNAFKQCCTAGQNFLQSRRLFAAAHGQTCTLESWLQESGKVPVRLLPPSSTTDNCKSSHVRPQHQSALITQFRQYKCHVWFSQCSNIFQIWSFKYGVTWLCERLSSSKACAKHLYPLNLVHEIKAVNRCGHPMLFPDGRRRLLLSNRRHMREQ